MAKRCIGIDLASKVLRVAIVTLDKGGPTKLETAQRPCGDRAELPALLREILGTEPGFGDRLVMALPARDAFVREIAFPFADPRKIAATLPLEMATQLPLPVEEAALAALPPRPGDDGLQLVTAAAVRLEPVAELLAIFDSAGLPLHLLDLAPYALATGLHSAAGDGLQVAVSDTEACVALVQDGAVRAYRALPLPMPLPAATLAMLIVREGTALRRANGAAEGPLWLVGTADDEALAGALATAGEPATRPALKVAGRPVAAEFVPAVALALRGLAPEGTGGFNFRQGNLALRSEWASLRARLITAGGVILAALLILAISSWLSYASKAKRAEDLNKEMVRIYRSAFPGTGAIVDVPLQMQSKIRELRTKTALVGGDRQFTPLEVLKTLSERIPPDLTVDIRDLNYAFEGVRLEGTTTTFEAVNRLAKTLAPSPLFKEAQISDAKMSLDGKTVDFRLTLTRQDQEVAP